MNEKDELIIKSIISIEDDNKLREYIISLHPYDVAKVFNDLDEEIQERLYRILTSEEIADIFSYMKEEDAADYLEEMDAKQSSSILNEMDVDDAVDIIQELDDPDALVDMLEGDTKEDINDLTEYEDDTAGSIMTTNFIQIESDLDVKDAMKELVTKASEAEVIDPLFVCQNDRLVGVLDLKDLIIARSPKQIDEIMDSNFIYGDVDEEIEEINKKINNYDIYALPILDNGNLCGIVTIDDAFDAIEKSVHQDYKQMAAINSINRDDTFFGRFIKRLPWLIILLVLSFVVSNILGLFEGIIRQVTILAFFQTLLLDMAGNIGTQSLAVTIQKMTNDELDTNSKVGKHIFRESKICLINSLILAVFAFLSALIFLLIKYDGEKSIYLMSLVICISLFLSLFLSGIISCVLPLILRKIKIDPAVASGPFITTINDIFSIVIYFSMAILLLGLVA